MTILLMKLFWGNTKKKAFLKERVKWLGGLENKGFSALLKHPIDP
jgi:hypothetical protein